MADQEQPSPQPHTVRLIEGERVPKTHVSSLVEWEPGKPPGGKPIAFPNRRRTHFSEVPAEKPAYRVTLIEGERAPEVRPIAKVEWEPGKPPGGVPIAKPSDQNNRSTNQ